MTAQTISVDRNTFGVGNSRFPRVLLLTDIPPCRDLTAGIVLHQLCSFLPEDSLSCFAVISPFVDAKLDSHFQHIPYETATKPAENYNFAGKLQAMKSFWRETSTAMFPVKEIARKVAQFAKEAGADKLWCVLQGQTMIRLATLVAEMMDKPLLTQVWDPPEWWLRVNLVDSFSQRSILNAFERALKRSECCAAASQGMAEEYRNKYGCNAIPVVAGIDKRLALPPATSPNHDDVVVIALAGQIYAEWEWQNLLETLDKVNWKIGGRKIIVRVLGRAFSSRSDKPRNLEYMGFRSQAETIRCLNQADILYCPYWFNPMYEKECRQSFPSKLTTYLASGRPVLFHGPEYASASRFLDSYNAAVLCKSYSHVDIYDSIRKLILDVDLYREVARNGRTAFDENLTHDRMKAQFHQFLGV